MASYPLSSFWKGELIQPNQLFFPPRVGYFENSIPQTPRSWNSAPSFIVRVSELGDRAMNELDYGRTGFFLIEAAVWSWPRGVTHGIEGKERRFFRLQKHCAGNGGLGCYAEIQFN
jgi:hypothetical protein